MRRATITSLTPGRNMRPSMIFTYGRIVNAIGVTPRTRTFEPLGSSFFGILKMMTSSGEMSGAPFSWAMPGRARMMRNASLVTQLESSAAAPSRMTIRLSFDPDDTTAECTPFFSAIIEIITAMTTPMPRIVISVETRRAFRLPMLYLSGIIRPPSSDRRRRADWRREAREGHRRSGRLRRPWPCRWKASSHERRGSAKSPASSFRRRRR